MHILLGILSTLSILAFFLIRSCQVASAMEDLSDRAGGLAARLRRRLFPHKVPRHPLSQIQDPREGALALMVAIMKDGGNLTEEQIRDLEFWAADRLNFENPADMVALARWHVRDFAESGAVLHRLHKPLAAACTGEQRADIIALVEAAAKSRGRPTTLLQEHTIRQLKYHFGDVQQRTLADAS